MIPQIASGLATLAADPRVIDVVAKNLPAITNGKVKTAKDIVPYVSNNPSKLKAVVDWFARATPFKRDDLMPPDLVRSDIVRQIAQGVGQIHGDLNAAFMRGASTAIQVHTPRSTAEDVIRIRRIKTVLDVYGTWERYKLCHPNGGVPDEDYAFFVSMRKVM